MSRLQAIEIVPARVMISPFAFLPILEEKKGHIVLINKNARNYSYNLFENNHLVFSSVMKTEAELTNRIEANIPDEILLANVSNDILPNGSTISAQSLDEYLESYGAALYGLAEYPCNLSLIRSSRKRLNVQTVLMFFFNRIPDMFCISYSLHTEGE